MLNTLLKPDIPYSDVILKDVLGKAVLLGLIRRWGKLAVYGNRNDLSCIKKYELPDGMARLDVLFVEGVPAGSIVSLWLGDNLYHVIGMFLKSEYRSRSYTPENAGQAGLLSQQRFSDYLMSQYLDDMVLKNKRQITLEVLDGNAKAWKLYERMKLVEPGSDKTVQFDLLNKSEIINYANFRNKKIENFYKVVTRNDKVGQAVRWTTTPDYGEANIVWGINRLYLIKPLEQVSIFLKGHIKNRNSAITLIISALKYGSVVNYLRLTLSSWMASIFPVKTTK